MTISGIKTFIDRLSNRNPSDAFKKRVGIAKSITVLVLGLLLLLSAPLGLPLWVGCGAAVAGGVILLLLALSEGQWKKRKWELAMTGGLAAGLVAFGAAGLLLGVGITLMVGTTAIVIAKYADQRAQQRTMYSRS